MTTPPNANTTASQTSLKGSNSTAQGNAPGLRRHMSQALKGRDRFCHSFLCRPYRASPTETHAPRALPWAILSQPFRLKSFSSRPLDSASRFLARVGLAILLSLSVATASRAGVEMRLAPLPDEAVTPEGFTPAELAVADANGQLPRAAQALTLRRQAGGPTMFYQASIAPGTRGSFRVMLPMVSVRQAYVVRLLADASPTAAVVLRQTVTAETDNVGAVEAARNLLIDPPAYDDYIENLPRWPTWATRNVLATSLLMLVAMGATLLVRRPAWRLAVAGVVVAVASGAIHAGLADCPLVITRQNGNILAVSSRRTTTWSAPAEGLGPIYWRARQMDQDDMVYQPGRTLTLTLHPNEVRLFSRRTADRAP